MFGSLPQFNKQQHRRSKWLTKLYQRFVLSDIDDEARKIKFCQVFIGQTGDDILTQLPCDISWEEAKGELAARLEDGIIEEEAWMALKQLERGDRDIIDLRAEAVKLAMKAYTEQKDTANRQAIEAFVCVLDPKLALEVQKLVHRTLDDVTATARRIEQLQKDYPSPNIDNLVSVLQNELWAVRNELKGSSATMADNVVRVAQPVVVPSATTISMLPIPFECAPLHVDAGASSVITKVTLQYLALFRLRHLGTCSRWDIQVLPLRAAKYWPCLPCCLPEEWLTMMGQCL